MRILRADEMRAVDRWAIDDIGIPGMVLMENAAVGVADAVAKSFPSCRSPAILCGPGNNGGDGLALSRLLAARGYRPRTLVLVRQDRRITGDAGQQLSILAKSGFEPEFVDPGGQLDQLIADCLESDLLIDSLFGTGLDRPLSGGYARVIESVARLPIPTLAVDLPSGLDASSRRPIGPAFSADVTVTFAAPKPAHVFAPARDLCGEIVVTDLGLPPSWEASAPGNLHLSLRSEIAALRLVRPSRAHKGDFGHCLLVAGSPGKSGAAALAARAAVKAGAGLVTVAVPGGLEAEVVPATLEAMTVGVAATRSGTVSETALDVLKSSALGKAAVGIGPGLGTSVQTARVIRRLVRALAEPVILDADGLNAFAGRAEELSDRGDRITILTPHPGELGRLLECSTAEVQADRVAAVCTAVDRTGSVVILKGEHTLIGSPDGEIWVNPTGNIGMASGGSGDVLTGMVTALVGSGYEAVTACRIAAFVHGEAGDLQVGEGESLESLCASDLIAGLGAAFHEVFEK